MPNINRLMRVCFQPLRHYVLPPLYFAEYNTPQCYGARQGRRLECFVLLRRKLQKLRNVLYSSSSAHECAIGEVSARTEGLKTPSYQSVYTGHLIPSPFGHSPLYRCAVQGERFKIKTDDKCFEKRGVKKRRRICLRRLA